MTNYLSVLGAGYYDAGVVVDTTIYYLDATNGHDTDDGSSGLPWQTLTKVNSYSFNAGDTIKLKCGDSYVGVRLYPTVSGSSDAKIHMTYYGDTTAGMPAINVSTGAANAYNVNGKSHWKFTGIDFRGGTSYVMMINTAGIEFYGCEVQGNGVSEANGISAFTGCVDLVVDSCIIHDNLGVPTGGAGLFVSAATGVTITGGSFYSNGNDQYDHGIYITESHDVVVRGVEAYSNSGHGIQIQDSCTNVVVDRNYSHDNTKNGIFVGLVSSTGNISVTNNIVVKNGNTGIFSGATSPSTRIINNTLEDNGTAGTGNGVYIGATGVTFLNNLLVQHYDVVGACRPLRVEGDSVVSSNIDYNDYYYTDSGADFYKIVVRSTPGMGYTLAEWQAHGGAPDSHGIASNPLYDTDYIIPDSSPCKNAGVYDDTVVYDYAGNERTDPYSIGAYE